MKKLLAIIIVTLALCLAAGCVLATEPNEISITANGQPIPKEADNLYSVEGSYYYKVHVKTDLEAFQVGWADDPEAAEPESPVDENPLDHWRLDPDDPSLGYCFFMFPPESDADAMFYRKDGSYAWNKIVFQYDSTNVGVQTGTDIVTVTTDENPQLYQEEPYTVEWSGISGTDGYIFHWNRTGDEEMSFTGIGNFVTLTDERYGGPEETIGKIGRYCCSVDVLKDGQLLTAPQDNVKEFTIAPVLRFSGDNEERVTITADDAATMPLYQWVLFDVDAPGALSIETHAADPEQELSDETAYDGFFYDNEGYNGFQWIFIGNDSEIEWTDPEEPEGNAYFTKTIIAEARIPDGADGEYSVFSNPITVTTERSGEIEGDITFMVPDDENDVEGDVVQVARDGRLFVNVWNYYRDENNEYQPIEADFFGLYIREEGSDTWLADSHWVSRDEWAPYTRVPLTVARCTADDTEDGGENTGLYEVRVFAIRFGSLQKDAEETIPIHVTAPASKSPVLLSMGNRFYTGDPLRVFAHYDDPHTEEFPDGIPNGALRIRILEKDNPDNVVFDEMQGYEDFWNDTECIWQPGTYTVEAEIWQYGEHKKTYPDLLEFEVISDGTLNAPQVAPFATATAGEDLELELSAEPLIIGEEEENTEEIAPDWFEYVLFRTDWDYAFIDSGRADMHEDGTGTVRIGRDCLEAGGQYFIRLFSMRGGFEPGVNEFRFLAVAPETEETRHLTLTVNESGGEAYDTLSSKNMHIVVGYDEENDPRPTIVRIMNGDRWDYLPAKYEEMFERDWGYGEGQYVCYAEATWDEIDVDDINWEEFDWNRDVDWSGRSNAIRLNITSPYGEMIAPTISLVNEDDEIPWGDDVIVHVGDEGPMMLNEEAEGGKTVNRDGWFFCHLYIERSDDDGNTWWEHYNDNYDYHIISGNNYIPTYNLESGVRYQLEIGADGEGYSGRSSNIGFSVGERPENPEASFKVNGSAENYDAQTNEELQLSAFYPGADRIEVRITTEDEPEWEDCRDNCASGMLMDNWSKDRPGTYTFTAYACWGEEENEEIGTIIVTVTAPNGRFEEAQAITVNDEETGSAVVPLLEEPNQNVLDIWINEIAGADDYHIEIMDAIGNWTIHDENWHATGNKNSRIKIWFEDGDNSFVEPGRLITIRCEAHGKGYLTTETERTFMLENAALEEGLILTVNGSDQNLTVNSNQDVRVRVTYGEERPTAVRILNGNNWEYWWDEDGREDDYTRDWSYGDGDYVLYAEATWDPLDLESIHGNGSFWEEADWSAKSNAVRMSVSSPYGEMAVPAFTTENTELEWGEDLIFTITDEVPGDTEGKPVGEGWFFFNLDVERGNDFDTWWDRLNDIRFQVHSGVNYFPTFMLEPGLYQFEVGADAEGYSGRSRQVVFAVGERPENDDTSVFRVNGSSDNTEVLTGEELHLSAYHAGAEWCYVKISKEEEEGWEAECSEGLNGALADTWIADHSGTYILTAYAYGHDEDTGEEWECPIGTICVTATSEDELDPPDVNMPDKAHVGDTITIKFNAIENAEKYSYWIHSEYNDDWLGDSIRTGAGPLTIDTHRLEPGVYWVETDAMAKGYEPSHGTVHFALLDPDAEDLSAEDGADPYYYFTITNQEIQTRDGAQIVAYMPGTDWVRLYLEDKETGDLGQLDDREGPGLSTWFGRNKAGRYGILLSGHDGSGWSDPTEVCEVTIAAKYGDLDAPAVTVNGSSSGNTVPALSDDPGILRVSITKTEHANDYYLEIRELDTDEPIFCEQINPDEHNGDTISLTIEDEGGRIKPGRAYRLYCENGAQGYSGSETERVFVLGNNIAQTLTLTVDGSAEDREINSSTSFRVKVGYPEGNRPTAVRIQDGNRRDIWWGEEDNYERDWGFGDDMIILYAEATWDDLEELDTDNPEFNWDDEVQWTGKSNVIRLDITSPNGIMAVPTFTVGNRELDWGEDLVITVEDETPMVIDLTEEDGKRPIDDGWFFFNLNIARGDEDNPWWDHFDCGDIRIHSGENIIPTYMLEPGRYRFELGADGEGYSGRSGWVEFTVGERNEEEPVSAFTVNGSAEDREAQTQEEVMLSAYRTGADCYVEISREGDEDWGDRRDGGLNGIVLDYWKASEEGTYLLSAYACTDGEEEPELILIGTITVTVEAPNGDLDEPSAEMNDKAYVGDRLTITFNAVENAEEYSYWIHPANDGNWLLNDSRRGAGTLIIDTGRLDGPAVYCVELDAMARGYNQSHSRLYFALLEAEHEFGAEDPGYYANVDPLGVVTEEEASITVMINGADELRFCSSKDPDGEPVEFHRCDGPGTRTAFSAGKSGNYDILISGRINGEWCEPINICTICVSAAHEFEAPPQVTVNGSGDGDTVPADGENPEKLTIVIDRDEDATGYDVRLRQAGDGWAFYDRFINLYGDEDENDYNDDDDDRDTITVTEDTITIEFSDDMIIAPESAYRIECTAHASNYECIGSQRTFLLTGIGEAGMELYVTPTAEDGFWTAEETKVQASADNEEVTAIRIRANGEERYFHGNEVTDETWTIWNTENVFHAYATTDELPEGDFNWNEANLNWSIRSEPVFVEAQSLGDTDVPTLTITNDHVTKGEWFEFTIEEDGDARQTDIAICTEDGEEREHRRYWEPGTYRIPTVNLDAGETYRVTISSVQSRHDWTYGPEQELYVEEPEEAEAIFSTDKAEVFPHEPFIPTLYVPGAAHIWIADEQWDKDIDNHDGIWGDWEGESGTNDANWEWWFDEPGDQQLIAYAQYGSPQIEEVKRITITVKEPTPLNQAVINVPDEVDVNKDLEIRVALIPHGYHYGIQLHSPAEGDDFAAWPRQYKNADMAENGELVFTFGAATLVPNQSYWIDCDVDINEYDYAYCRGSSSRCILTTDGDRRDEGIVLSVVPGDGVRFTEDGVIVPAGTPFEVKVSRNADAETPVAVALFMGDQRYHQAFSENDGEADSVIFEVNERQGWSETIYARAYYYDPEDPEAYDEEAGWDQVSGLEWGNPSNSLRLTSTYGAVGAAVISDVPQAVIAGHDIVIRVDNAGENATVVRANLNRNTDGWPENYALSSWVTWAEDQNNPGTGTIMIPTNKLATGLYRLNVESSDGDEYEPNQVTALIRIVEDPAGLNAKWSMPSGLKEIEDEAFTGIAAHVIIIPDGVTTIGVRAFADSQVETVVIPASVTTIREGAFSGCSLTLVYGNGEAAATVAEEYGAVYCSNGN